MVNEPARDCGHEEVPACTEQVEAYIDVPLSDSLAGIGLPALS